MDAFAFILSGCQPVRPLKHLVLRLRAPDLEAQRDAEEARGDKVVYICVLSLKRNVELPFGWELLRCQVLGPPLSVYQLRKEVRPDVG